MQPTAATDLLPGESVLAYAAQQQDESEHLMTTFEIFIQAIVGLLIITAPFDPVKILFFNSALESEGSDRRAAAGRVALVVLVILGVSALIGRELLQLFGINLGAFGFVGGLIVASMGFEMLYSGGVSKAQGRDIESEGPEEDSGLIIPLAIPLIAGPGAIATTVAIASRDDTATSMFSALLGVGAVALVTFVSMAYLSDMLSRLKPQTTQFLLRIGGLLLATLGTQLAMSGIRTFYGF